MPDQRHIIMVSVADLPEGGGHTARMEGLVATLTGLGHSVMVWNEHALGTTSAATQQVRGMIGGSPFEYVLGRTERSDGFGMVYEKMRAVHRIARLMRAAAAKNKLDFVCFNDLSFYDTFPLTRLARRLGARTIQLYEDERLELVSVARRSMAVRVFGLNARLADRICPPMADAIVVISDYLKTKYNRLGRGTPVWLVPTIIDCDLWECPPEKATDCPMLLYAGTFGEQDEIDHLIDAFAIVRDRGQPFRVVMAGDNLRNPARMKRIRQAVEKRGLSTRVVFPGYVSQSVVRDYLDEAAVLLNLRRDGVWSRSGLSTKLSEYLASGRMVLASAVGEVPRYLQDGENAMLVSRRVEPQEIADALCRALGSIALRREIGRKGQIVARRCFDVHVAAEKIDALLREMSTDHRNA